MLMHEIVPRGFGNVGGRWAVRPPKAPRAFWLPPDVTVDTHDDGTITVLGGVIVSGEPGDRHYWRGALVRGVWHEELAQKSA